MDNPDFRAKNQPNLDEKFTKERFKGKVAVIVGGASGLGFATAERFASDGASIALIDISKENGAKAEEFIKVEGYEKVRYYYADVTNRSACDAAAKSISEDNDGVIDFLINSAVHFCAKGLESDRSEWQKINDVNVYGCVAMVQACYPYLSKAAQPAVVNFSSIAAHRAQNPRRWTYSATKGAIKTMTKNMALELSKNNIRVNSISPGYIWTPEMAKASPDGTMDSMTPAISQLNILRRIGTGNEVASVAAFLCSRDAAYITGTNLLVDGGYCAMGPEGHISDSLFAGTQKNLDKQPAADKNNCK